MSAGESIIRKLNDLEHRLARTETWEGGGGGGGGCAGPYIIAASDASATAKSCATVVCDGVADEVEINAAIVLLTANGRFAGEIWLTAGNFYLAAGISVTNDMSIRGQGFDATLIRCDNNQVTNSFTAITCGSVDLLYLRELTIYVNASFFSGTKTGRGVQLTGATRGMIDDILISNCDIAIEFTGATWGNRVVEIKNCRISANSNGIKMLGLATSTVITNNHVYGGGDVGAIALHFPAGLYQSRVENNKIEDFDGDGIVVNGTGRSYIRDNMIEVSGNCIEVTG